VSGGPFSHRHVQQYYGTFKCSVCGLVAPAPHDGPGCPAGVDMVRDWNKLDQYRPVSGAREAEKVAQELHRMLTDKQGES